MRKTLLAAVLTLLASAPAGAAPHRFGSFIVDDQHPNVLVLAGDVTPSAPLDFHRALDEFPQIDVLGLHSRGGDVLAGLMIALEVLDRGINTQITTGKACYSACAYIFLAGASRQVDGELGTHMPTVETMESADRVAVELDMRYVLAKLKVPIVVFDSIFNTPNGEIRIFDAAEAAALGLNR